jgi:hypothetical protein
LGLRVRPTVRRRFGAALLVLSASCTFAAQADAALPHASDISSASLRFHASGTWSSDPLAFAGDTVQLDAVSCAAASSCVAVGVSFPSTGSADSRSLGETWNGTSWSATAAPPVPANATTSGLLSVSCVSTTFCMAVGSYESSAGTRDLAERWNGTSWSELPVPASNGARVSQLRSVSCVSSSFCTAVGDGYKGADTAVSIAEHFNGAKWTSQSLPFTAGATYVQLHGVSCASSQACVAVGTEGNRSESSGAEFTLADRWNGAKWVQLSSVNALGDLYRGFESVSCPTTTYCVAVGNDTNKAGTNTTMSEVLTGAKWSPVTPPATPGGEFRNLFGVSCTTTTNCVAVGFYDTTGHVYMSLADQWNGITWARQSTPDATGETLYSELFGVSCATAGCSAVGTDLAISES